MILNIPLNCCNISKLKVLPKFSQSSNLNITKTSGQTLNEQLMQDGLRIFTKLKSFAGRMGHISLNNSWKTFEDGDKVFTGFDTWQLTTQGRLK